MGDRKIAVTAEQLHGAERDEAWLQITAAAPRFAKANCRWHGIGQGFESPKLHSKVLIKTYLILRDP
jgi:hypothetical protein